MIKKPTLHTDLWEIGGKDTRILNLSTRWKCVVGFTPQKALIVPNIWDTGWASELVWML
jgi:hypothetical protein